MSLQKVKPWRSEKYKKWVRSQPCIITGRTDRNVCHHIIGCNMGGVIGNKPSDLFTIPLDAEIHQRFHSCRKSIDIDQKAEALRTIERAIHDGILIMGDFK